MVHIPVCPSLMCFFNRGNAEGTNSLKILCLMFVYFLFYRFVSGLILWLGDNLWCDDLCKELIGDRLKFVLALMSFVVDLAQSTN